MLYNHTRAIYRSIHHALLPLALLTAAAVWLAGAAPAAATDAAPAAPQAEFARGSETIPLEKRPGYVPTPIGERSEAYDNTETGPNHLRRMSRTEPLAAEPQITKVLPIEPQPEHLR